MSTEILRDDATDTAFNTLTEDSAGYFVIARAGLATPGVFATGDTVDVFPATILSGADNSPGRNDPDSATVEAVITDDPSRAQTI